jgi:hypothetical protein
MSQLCDVTYSGLSHPGYGLHRAGENHSYRGSNFHPVFIPLNQLLGAILDCGFWIADLLYRFALSFLLNRPAEADIKSKF